MIRLSKRAKGKNCLTLQSHVIQKRGIIARVFDHDYEHDYDIFSRVRAFDYPFFEMRDGKVVDFSCKIDYTLRGRCFFTAEKTGKRMFIGPYSGIKKKGEFHALSPISKSHGHRKNDEWTML